MIDFDYLLEKVGTLGTYQFIVFGAIVYFGIPSGLCALASVFLSYSPPYRCMMYPFDNETMYPNISQSAIMNLTTPLNKDGEPEDACVKYSYDTSSCLNNADLSCVRMNTSTTICESFYFQKDLFTETTVSQFELVCDRRVLNTVASSMYMVGLLLGALIFGNLSDIIGRRYASILGSYGVLLAMLGVAYCNSVEAFIVVRCINAAFSMGTTIALFTHSMEIVGSKWRTLAGIGYQITFAVGYMFWSAIAYLYRDWHEMQLGAIVISAPLAIIILLIPESPRWLFARNRDKDGKKVVRLMAKLNKVKITDETWAEAEKPERKDKAEKKYSTIDLLKYPNMRIVTIKVAFNWCVNSMVYYGISLNAGSLAGDIFLNNIYAGVLEIASYLVCILVMDHIGRRLLLTITLTGAGLALLISTTVNEFADGNEAMVTAGVAFAFVAKALVSGSFAVVYNFTGELYPTVVRSNGLGFGATTARIGGILAPFIISIQETVSWLPNTIFGVFAVVAGLLSLTIRDTTGKQMMETIEEAELFYKGMELNKMQKENHAERTAGCDNKAAVSDNDMLTKF